MTKCWYSEEVCDSQNIKLLNPENKKFTKISLPLLFLFNIKTNVEKFDSGTLGVIFGISLKNVGVRKSQEIFPAPNSFLFSALPKQLSKVKNCGLETKGTLPFNFNSGACKVFSDQALLCFNRDDHKKRCHCGGFRSIFILAKYSRNSYYTYYS